MRKNIYLEFGNEYDLDTRLRLIKDIGFDGIFIWQDEQEDRIQQIVEKAQLCGLDIETMHLRFDGCNHLWLDDEMGEDYVATIIDGIHMAHRYHIRTVIMHTVSKEIHPDVNELGLRRIQTILRVCETYHIQLALENTRDLEYIDEVFNRISSPYLKMCFDSGHTHAFTYCLQDVVFEKYASKLACVHLHDNLGDYDAHLVPFSGTVDFQLIMNSLKSIGFCGPLTSEAHIGKEEVIDDQTFLEKVYAALCQLEILYGEQCG
ncbi:MAG: sugar phosphate isomerase/epimerase family protein [Bacilli bacterium]